MRSVDGHFCQLIPCDVAKNLVAGVPNPHQISDLAGPLLFFLFFDALISELHALVSEIGALVLDIRRLVLNIGASITESHRWFPET